MTKDKSVEAGARAALFKMNKALELLNKALGDLENVDIDRDAENWLQYTLLISEDMRYIELQHLGSKLTDNIEGRQELALLGEQ